MPCRNTKQLDPLTLKNKYQAVAGLGFPSPSKNNNYQLDYLDVWQSYVAVCQEESIVSEQLILSI